VSEFVYYIAALKYVLVKTLAATCFCQNGGKTKGGMEKGGGKLKVDNDRILGGRSKQGWGFKVDAWRD